MEDLVYWHWLALAAALVVIEVLLPGVLFLWLGIAAAVTGLIALALPALGWEIQVLVFAVLAVASVYLGRRFFQKTEGPTDHPLLNRRALHMIGKRYRLEQQTEQGRGRMRVGDSWWSVAVASGGDIPAGSEVTVVAVEGATLKVEKS